MILLRQQSFYFCVAVSLHQQTRGIPLNGCYQERVEFPGRLPQVIFCLYIFSKLLGYFRVLLSLPEERPDFHVCKKW